MLLEQLEILRSRLGHGRPSVPASILTCGLDIFLRINLLFVFVIIEVDQYNIFLVGAPFLLFYSFLAVSHEPFSLFLNERTSIRDQMIIFGEVQLLYTRNQKIWFAD